MVPEVALQVMKKRIKKVAFLLIATLVITVLWFAGMQHVYARALTFTTNAVLSVTGSTSNIQVEKQDDVHIFQVYKIIDDKQAKYPQKYGILLLPTVMIFAWILFVPFFRKSKAAMRSSIILLTIFMFIQVIFLLLLTSYYTSATASFFYDVMMDGFYIIALGIIIVDNLIDPVFSIHQG